MFILNIAAGKVLPIDPLNKNDILVNLDLNYFNSIDVKDVEKYHRSLSVVKEDDEKPLILYVNHDVYDFLERYSEKFDKIVIYRFLEHVPKVQVLYFLYLLSSTVKIGGTVEVIVPDYKRLAIRILDEKVNDIDFEAQDIITTFELLNEKYSPHLSVWTKDRAKHFFELEERFKVIEINENYPFDGRDIYLRFTAQRIK